MKNAARFCFLLLLMLCCGCGSKELPSVNLFFTSDIEGVFWARPVPRYGNEVTGGLSILKAFLDKQNVPFVLLDGGNWFAQTPEGTLTKGDYFNSATSSIPYSGRLFTEKDLVYGWGSLSHIMKDSPAPFILSNVTLSNGKLPAGAKAYLLENAGDYKIGVFGLVGRHAVKGKQRLGGLKITDEIAAAKEAVQTLRAKGAHVVVLLSALGMPQDEVALTDALIAEEVPGIDVIIGSNWGHEEAESEEVGKTLIVYPGAKLDGVGQVRLFFTKDKELAKIDFEDVVLYRRDYGENELVAEQVADIRRAARGQMNRPVGKISQEMKGNLNEESVLGNWAADCLRKWAKTDVAVINSDSLRAELPAGQITQYDLYQLYPYADNVTYLTMKGEALLEALEAGLNVPGNFAQIAGLKISYNPEGEFGKKLLSVQVNGVRLSPSATYRVAVTDHMLAGGAGHDAFIDSLEFKNTQVEMRTVLRLCLAGNKDISVPATNRWRKVK